MDAIANATGSARGRGSILHEHCPPAALATTARHAGDLDAQGGHPGRHQHAVARQ